MQGRLDSAFLLFVLIKMTSSRRRDVYMTKEELAKLIKDRVVLIGTGIEHIESMSKYSSGNRLFELAFALIYISLQNSIHIELFKLFDRGKDASNYNIYALIDMIEDENKSYHKMLSKYNSDIQSIRNRRNYVFAHELGKNISEVFADNQVSSFKDLLQCVADICCKANEKLYPNICVSNVRYFDEWFYISIKSMNDIMKLNEKLIQKDVSWEFFESNLDDFITELKHKYWSEIFKDDI